MSQKIWEPPSSLNNEETSELFHYVDDQEEARKLLEAGIRFFKWSEEFVFMMFIPARLLGDKIKTMRRIESIFVNGFKSEPREIYSWGMTGKFYVVEPD